MSPAEYRSTVLALVHDIRVDPLDATARLILCDFMEEHGRPEAARTAANLRKGTILCYNSLDLTLAKILEYYCMKGDKRVIGLRDRGALDGPYVSPEDYALLWQKAFRYRNQIAGIEFRDADIKNSYGFGKLVIEELKLIQKDRAALKRKKKQQQVEKEARNVKDLPDQVLCVRETSSILISTDN